MSLTVRHKHSSVLNRAPLPSDLSDGELALNYNAKGPFLTCKDSAGNVRKLNNVWVAATPPTGPSAGDLWLDTSAATAVLKVYKDSTTTWVVSTGGTVTAATTTTKGIVQLADAAAVTAGTAGRVVDAAQLKAAVPPASETVAGIVELATAAETTTGTNGTKAVHPAGLKVELDKKAPLASPALTGTPTAPTAAAGTNTTQLATTAFVTAAVAVENNWDRTGTVVSPANAGDQVHTGTGKLTVGGTAAAPNLEVKADGGIVANTNGLVYDAATKRLGIGTTSPGALLQVSAGTTETAGNITRLDTYYTGIADAVRISNQGDFGASSGRGMRLSFTTGDSTAGYLQNEGLSGSRVFSFINQDQAFLVSDRTNSVLSLSAPGTTSGVVDLNYRSGGTSFLGARIDSSGRLLVGTSSARSNYDTALAPRVQIESTSVDGTRLGIVRNAASAGSGSIFLGKTRSAANGGNDIVISGDGLGNIDFYGADGTNLIKAASIGALVDGTPGANDMPCRIVLSTTADGASSPTERLRISSTGTISTTQALSTTTVFSIRNSSDTGSQTLLEMQGGTYTTSDTTTKLIVFKRGDGTEIGSVIRNGATTVNYATSSDYRLKENIKPLTGALAKFNTLKPSRFNFIGDTRTVDGFIAHEVQSVVPEAITGEKDAVDEDGNPIYQGIDQSKLVPLLTAALQEAVAKIESLEARLTAAGI